MSETRDRGLSIRVETDIARANELFDRIAGRAGVSPASTRRLKRGTASAARRMSNIGIALAVIFAATITLGLVLNGIGLGGLFIVMCLVVLAVLVFGMWSPEKPIAPYKDEMPNKTVVQRLAHVLDRERSALPAPAAQTVDAIHRQLPLIESKLDQLAPLDPLAQDARRLMGRHLPDLIEHYQRVPTEFRRERDAEGLTADDRLVQSLGAARSALDDLSRKLAHEDLTAFQTQGRFIESRYKDDGAIEGR